MTNILLDLPTLDVDWLYPALKKYLHPDQKVAVIGYSFDPWVKNLDTWNALYGPNGRYRDEIVDPFQRYGIRPEQMTFLSYFGDEPEQARNDILNADVVYFLGGLPDLMMDRLRDKGLVDVLQHHPGIIMGYSAGAVIQLAEYHLSPDADYPDFAYHTGIPYLDGFYLQVHYDQSEVQKDAIRKVLAERRQPVYTFPTGEGAMIVDDGNLETIGHVELFTDPKQLD